MKLWDDIRNYFYQKGLTERLAGLNFMRHITNLSDARSIGIIYDSTNPDNDIIITKFAEHLRNDGKTVDILGYVDDKKIDHKADILVFNRKNLNWARLPEDDRVEKFADRNFDLLLGCFIGENLPLEYVARIARAKWRVGPYMNEKVNCYDMMVNIGSRTDLNYLLDQCLHFLNELRYDTK